uniref:Putative Biotin biosynthesis protein BioC n=1 Tax=Magnetococcus massalia (strain MO-1) TaxID=451514 RepID=A0A1S7LLY0_MAGMO|nr:Putative Biotin biosynthesis protein BioC [Candidatus Magnetococcus massalia]
MNRFIRPEGQRRSRHVAERFGSAVNYHNKALLQQHVAEELADRLHDYPLPERPRVLEIGCGTGFLSRHLLRQWPEGEFLFTDIAPEMIKRCQSHLADIPGDKNFAVMDGELNALTGGFDLVVSSLAFQWFEDLSHGLMGLSDLLRHNGLLAFATLGEETFQEWQALCERNNAPFGRPDYPHRQALIKMLPQGGEGDVEEDRIPVDHASVLGFLRTLKAVGAHLPAEQHRPVSAATMRRLIHATRGQASAGRDHGFQVTYHVLYGFFTRSEDERPIH